MRIYDQIERRIAIDKGWSGDRKFKLITNQGESYLLRISPEEKWERLLDSFSKMQGLAEQGIPMCRPVEIGRCDDGVYVIHSWVSGRDAEDVIPSVSLQKQYQYGVDAGRILKTIHTLPAPSGIRGGNRRVPLISDSDRRVPAAWGQESQASSWVEAWNSA